MKTSLAIYDLQTLRAFIESRTDNFDQVVLHLKDFSRKGTIPFEELATYKNLPMEISVVWDVLMPEEEFIGKKYLFEKAKNLFPPHVRWRVVDMGAIHYLVNHCSPVNLEVDVTTGFHNFLALKALQNFVGPALKKMVLSLELPETELREIHTHLHTPTEILVLGPIPLFYTPRHLLQRYKTNRALGKSEETPHRGFIIEDNNQGTFMWLPKNIFLLDHLDEIASAGVDWVRFDCPLAWALDGVKVIQRFNHGHDHGHGHDDWKAEALLLKKKYDRPTSKGFFKANRTDSIFPKLKNQILRNKNNNRVADIIDLEKERFMVAHAKLEIKLGDTLAMQTPEGRVKSLQVKFLKNSMGQEITVAKPGEVVLLPHVSGACVGSVLDRSQTTNSTSSPPF